MNYDFTRFEVGEQINALQCMKAFSEMIQSGSNNAVIGTPFIKGKLKWANKLTHYNV